MLRSCRIIKCYNGWVIIIIIYCGRDFFFPCKVMKKYKILNYIFTWLWSYIFIETTSIVLIISTCIPWSFHMVLQISQKKLLNSNIFCKTTKSMKLSTTIISSLSLSLLSSSLLNFYHHSYRHCFLSLRSIISVILN
jgi:hypothetical protein